MNELKPPRVIQFRLRVGNEIVGYEKWDESDSMWLYRKNATGDYPDGIWRPSFIYHIQKDQFTGLQDKNGTEVYERDVVKWVADYGTEEYSDEREMFEEVKFEGGAYQILASMPESEFEVAGNIYQHPGLLKGKTLKS